MLNAGVKCAMICSLVNDECGYDLDGHLMLASEAIPILGTLVSGNESRISFCSEICAPSLCSIQNFF